MGQSAVVGCKSWEVRLTQLAVRLAETQTGPKNLAEELPEPMHMGSPLLSDPSSLCAGQINAVERVAKVIKCCPRT